MTSASPAVLAVARDDGHRFSKPVRDSITLVADHGVEGDAHAGATVQHLHDKRHHPDRPNLRQVHLMHAELFAQVADRGHVVEPGQLGENITTEGIDLLDLPARTRLRLGEEAVVEVTGLRNPCTQINGLSRGLMKELVRVDDTGATVRLSGVMSVVIVGGVVRPGDRIDVVLPDGAPEPLKVV
ncbi:MOSC domain-containing protein [Planococcus sp. APC 4015]|nr:MOSC domain-containing protein [Planococcus sp. APC 4015]